MTTHLQMTVLGCGSSGGVPRVGGDWGVCDPTEPKNRRTRCSVLIEQWQGAKSVPEAQRTIILVDTSPDLREQLLLTQTKHIDAVLFTHEHADQTHGIDDVRALAYRMRSRIPAYMDDFTKGHVVGKFSYLFEMPEGRVHPPILDLQPLFKDGDTIKIDGPGGVISIDVLGISHGPTPAFGFKFNDQMAYTPDVWSIPPQVIEKLQNIDYWVMDALRYNEHPTHAHADRAMQWIAKTSAKQGILTNLHIDMDYATLSEELPGGHLVGYDGMIFETTSR